MWVAYAVQRCKYDHHSHVVSEENKDNADVEVSLSSESMSKIDV